MISHSVSIWYFTEYEAALIIYLDNSENVGLSDWNLMIKYVQDVCKKSAIGPDKTHVAIVDVGTL